MRSASPNTAARLRAKSIDFSERSTVVTCAPARKIDRVRPNPAPDFQHLLPAPPGELRKSRYVVFHKVFPCLDLVEVFLCPHRRSRMPYVAGTLIPVIPDPRDLHIGKR